MKEFFFLGYYSQWACWQKLVDDATQKEVKTSFLNLGVRIQIGVFSISFKLVDPNAQDFSFKDIPSASKLKDNVKGPRK